MNEVQLLLDLPIDTFAGLASGYLGYRLAYVGKDQKHHTVDVVFISAVFALLARVVSDLASPFAGVYPALIFGILAAAIGAALWRKWLSNWLYRVLRRVNVSQSDGHDDAFTSMRLRAGFAPSTLVVITTNGTALMCRDLRPFAAYRDGPCILGEDGSVAMYVTDRYLPDATEWEEMDVYTTGRGAQITYVPASQIAQIRVHQPD